MDPILQEIYSSVIGSAPYVIGGYALMWVVLLVYVLIVTLSLKKTERQMSAIEEALKERDSQKS